MQGKDVAMWLQGIGQQATHLSVQDPEFASLGKKRGNYARSQQIIDF